MGCGTFYSINVHSEQTRETKNSLATASHLLVVLQCISVCVIVPAQVLFSKCATTLTRLANTGEKLVKQKK